MPLQIEVLGSAGDIRTGTRIIYGKLKVSDYLELVGEDFQNFFLQRRREKHKAYYDRMKQDIIEGALLPSITLAVEPNIVPQILQLLEEKNFDGINIALSAPNSVNILDGLQRTFILKDLKDAGVEFKEGQSLHVEFWLETEIRHLVYRIIVLNAGQKPMPLKHQIDILFLTLKTEIEGLIPGLEIYTLRDNTRRRSARKYALDRLAMAYQCFLIHSPEIERENIVAQQLVEAQILDSSEANLNDNFNRFVKYLDIYASLDDEICRIYPSKDEENELPTGAQWFSNENVLNSFFAAIGSFTTSEPRRERIENALKTLHDELSSCKQGDDPFGLTTIQSIIAGFNTRKVNVGAATRKFLTSGFKEFLLTAGETPLVECWKFVAE